MAPLLPAPACLPLLTAPPWRAGMAGSGKTTFMQRLNAHLHERRLPGYLVNLDPAVTHLVRPGPRPQAAKPCARRALASRRVAPRMRAGCIARTCSARGAAADHG